MSVEELLDYFYDSVAYERVATAGRPISSPTGCTASS